MKPHLLLAFALGCRDRTPPPVPMPPLPAPEVESAVSLDSLLGHWVRADGQGSETWVQAGEHLVGVGFEVAEGRTHAFELLSLGATNGGTEYVAMPGGDSRVAFPLVDPGQLLFENPAHDFPTRIRYERQGESLSARVEGPDGKGVDFYFQPAPLVAAPALEEADRVFDLAVAERGLDAWLAVFDPEGGQWGRDGRIEGEALRELMAPALAPDRRLRWTPRASGLSPAGDAGFTVGTWVASRQERGAWKALAEGWYVTVWRQQADGSWKVWFDTGVPL